MPKVSYCKISANIVTKCHIRNPKLTNIPSRKKEERVQMVGHALIRYICQIAIFSPVLQYSFPPLLTVVNRYIR